MAMGKEGFGILTIVSQRNGERRMMGRNRLRKGMSVKGQ
jgi:hypothetical protein